LSSASGQATVQKNKVAAVSAKLSYNEHMFHEISSCAARKINKIRLKYKCLSKHTNSVLCLCRNLHCVIVQVNSLQAVLSNILYRM
jgi:hypothetical protein